MFRHRNNSVRFHRQFEWFQVAQITWREKVTKLSKHLKLVLLFVVNSPHSLTLFSCWSSLCEVFIVKLIRTTEVCQQSSDNKIVPQYCSYSFTGVPEEPVTIFISASVKTFLNFGINKGRVQNKISLLYSLIKVYDNCKKANCKKKINWT